MKFKITIEDTRSSLSLPPDVGTIEFEAENEKAALAQVEKLLKSRDEKFKREKGFAPAGKAKAVELVKTKIVKKWSELGITRQMY